MKTVGFFLKKVKFALRLIFVRMYVVCLITNVFQKKIGVCVAKYVCMFVSKGLAVETIIKVSFHFSKCGLFQ